MSINTNTHTLVNTTTNEVVRFRRINLQRVFVTQEGGGGEMRLSTARLLWAELVAKGYRRLK